MADPFESRLREHLSSVDRAPVLGPDSLAAASERAAIRLRRRRGAGVAIASAALVSGASLVAWSNRPQSSDVVISREVSDAAPAATEPGPPEAVATSTTTVPTSTVAASSTWTAIAPDPRGITFSPSVVWTGDEALVAGGVDAAGLPRTGAVAYDPVTDRWRTLADSRGGSGRINPLVAWTGKDMLVIGGDNPDGSLLVSFGEAYDLAADAWRLIASPPVGFITERSPAAWTGSELLVWPWDGGGSTMEISPIAYDPVDDIWRDLAAPPIARRQQAASVWTGTEWIIWGGTTGDTEFDDGAAYDPESDTWRVIADSPLSPRRVRGSWTGEELIVVAGSTGGEPVTGNGELALADGAAYDPVAGTWRALTPGPAHPGFVPLWTGRLLVMLAKGNAFVYDVASDQWLDECCVGESGTAGVGTPVWTGSAVLAIGSNDSGIGGAMLTPPAATFIEEPTCSDPAAPDLDVANEPDWRKYTNYREWTRDGCLVRIDVLADRPGPDHCGWESARVIVTGAPLGSRYSNSDDDVEYIRDPYDVLGFAAGFEPDATLPPGAIDTAYRSGDLALWIVPGDNSAIYVVSAEGAERWPRGESPLCR